MAPQQPTTTQRIAENVRAQLARQRLTTAQLAAHLHATPEGLSRRTVYRMTNGETPWSPAAIEATAGYLGVPLADLFGLEEVAS